MVYLVRLSPCGSATNGRSATKHSEGKHSLRRKLQLLGGLFFQHINKYIRFLILSLEAGESLTTKSDGSVSYETAARGVQEGQREDAAYFKESQPPALTYSMSHNAMYDIQNDLLCLFFFFQLLKLTFSQSTKKTPSFGTHIYRKHLLMLYLFSRLCLSAHGAVSRGTSIPSGPAAMGSPIPSGSTGPWVTSHTWKWPSAMQQQSWCCSFSLQLLIVFMYLTLLISLCVTEGEGCFKELVRSMPATANLYGSGLLLEL